MQGGMSRDLFDMFASNPKDGLIIADFAVQGTLARSVLDSPADVLTRDGRKVGHLPRPSCSTACSSKRLREMATTL